ncbi:MAG TPA: FAD binding domain-containing protein, partial [Candidatus Limnocylindrales bacterium]|nr:FAD binding domain-containing protein [Candidatus Limnocylindrales bacterium]
MHPFTLERPPDLTAALALGAAGPATEYIAGGTDMLPLLKDELRRPDRLVALGRGVLDDGIEVAANGGLHLGAAARLSDVAEHPDVRR